MVGVAPTLRHWPILSELKQGRIGDLLAQVFPEKRVVS